MHEIFNKVSRFYNDIRYGFSPSIDLEESQWWSRERLLTFQQQRLKSIIEYAYKHIPAYKQKFDKAGIKPGEITTLDDLKKIPVTRREEMQDNPDFINHALIEGTLYTGGSTGTSLKYHESYAASQIRWNSHIRGWRWSGYEHEKDKLAVIASKQGIVHGKFVVNLSGDLNCSIMEKNIQTLLDFKPPYLRGYTSSLYILAKYCIDERIKIDFVKVADPISENLYPYQREVIEKGFACSVFEEYCCNDGGACAWECEEHQGLHYFMERAIIEEVDGEMIVTDLWNKAMPFIRYVNGDFVRFLDKQCPCGRKLPLVEVKGRTNDIIIGDKGPISPTFLMYHGIGYDNELEFRSGISAVQYVQKPGFILEVNIVKNSWCRDDEIKAFIKAISGFTSGLKLKINFVEKIGTTKKGKRQFIINEDLKLLKNSGYG